MANMGQEDARRGCVSWLVEPCDGDHIHRLVKSTHHQGAQALAKTHRLSLAAFDERMSLNAHLSGTSMRLGKLEDVQDLWPATCRHANRFHLRFLSFSPFGARVAGGRSSLSKKDRVACVT